MTDYRKKLNQTQPQDVGDDFVADPNMLEEYPALADFLCRYVYEGSTIKTATLALWCDDGQYKARLSDRETKRTMWLTLKDPKSMFSEVEQALETGSPGFRMDKKF